MTRPDDTLTVCAQCTICKGVYEYRTKTATRAFASAAATEIQDAERTGDISTSVMSITVALVHSVGYAMSFLNATTRQQLLEFLGRVGNVLADMNETRINNILCYVCLPSCMAGSIIWVIAAFLFFLNTCFMLLNTTGYIPTQLIATPETLGIIQNMTFATCRH